MYSTNLWHLLYLHCRQIGISIVFLWVFLPTSAWTQMHNLAKTTKNKFTLALLLACLSRVLITHSDSFLYHDSIKVVQSPNKQGFKMEHISDLHLGDNADMRFIPSLMFAEDYLTPKLHLVPMCKSTKQLSLLSSVFRCRLSTNRIGFLAKILGFMPLVGLRLVRIQLELEGT